MKLAFRDIEPFVKAPNKTARVILVYGPDDGLMRERAKMMGTTVVPDIHDPFNVAVLSAAQLAEDPARLADEANAMSMMGGDRLIRVENADDKLTTLIKEYLAAPNPNALIILEAGELGPRSSLRVLCEKATNAAALPCYVEDEKDLGRLIRETMQQANVKIESDAITWLASAISGDRMKARMELEKLITYKLEDESPITLDEARAVCGENGAQGLDELVYSVGGRRSEKAMRIYMQLLDESVPFVMVLRTLQNHFRRLHVTRARMESGRSIEDSMKMLQPQIFFKQEADFKGQTNSWNLKTLARVLDRLASVEAACKKTGAPTDALCAQAVLGISNLRG